MAAFTEDQVKELEKPLDKDRVKRRPGGGGTQLGYLEGHDIITTANRIFGYGNWGYDLVGVELEKVTNNSGEVVGNYYAARVRLTVAGCIPITEEGVCPVQEGKSPRAQIDAHDMARKGAVTDGLKRAMRCYGDQFGNSLYDRDLVDGQPRPEGQQQGQGQPRPAAPAPAGTNQRHPAAPPMPAPARVIADPRPRTLEEQLAFRLRTASTESTLYDIWGEEVENVVEKGSELYNRLRDVAASHKAQLQAQKTGAK